MSLASGHKFVHLEGEELAKQVKDFPGYAVGLVRLTPGRWLFLAHYINFADKLYSFKFKHSDVVVMAWPKCGTTWTQEIVWTMRNNPDLNHPQANLPVTARAPFLEMDMLLADFSSAESVAKTPILSQFKTLCPGKNPADGVMLQMTEATPEPRTIKTHLPFSLLTPSLLDTAKVVFVARNPKDVIVSYYHHSRLLTLQSYVGSFEDFVQYFVDDDLVFGPYWLFVKEAWEKRHHPNLHFAFYEDLKADMMGELRKLNTFLDTKLTEDQLKNVAKHTSFSEMKARQAFYGENPVEQNLFNADVFNKDGGFFRKGEAGDWKGKLTPPLEAKVNKWIADNMSNFGITFKYSV